MAKVTIDDGYAEHPVMVVVGPMGIAMDVAAMCYASRCGTDGFLPEAQVPRLVDVESPLDVARSLVDAGRWQRTEGGFLLCDFLEFNPSAEDRMMTRLRQGVHHALFWRDGLRSEVREKDGDSCRYCGVEVRWRDRRTAVGGTYDLVDPLAEIAAANIVVACRGCASKKGNRTLAEAGMRLIAAAG